MTLAFACAVGHAPGITAWPDAAPLAQRDRLYAGFAGLQRAVDAARLDAMVLFTSEHWANFFLNHISPFCIGRADSYEGPVEPWLKVERTAIKGDPALASALIEECYAQDLDPGYAHEMAFDHGTMVPLHFLMPRMDLPLVPVMINTLAPPQPSPRRCLALGRAVGDAVRRSTKRIGIVATGGMSHDPGEVNHGWIDEDFDRRFLEAMQAGDLARLERYTLADLAAAGAGALELLDWIALAGALGAVPGEVVAYEPVVPWATGIGLMSFDCGAALEAA